jgi:hypothetical protein
MKGTIPRVALARAARGAKNPSRPRLHSLPTALPPPELAGGKAGSEQGRRRRGLLCGVLPPRRDVDEMMTKLPTGVVKGGNGGDVWGGGGSGAPKAGSGHPPPGAGAAAARGGWAACARAQAASPRRRSGPAPRRPAPGLLRRRRAPHRLAAPPVQLAPRRAAAVTAYCTASSTYYCKS